MKDGGGEFAVFYYQERWWQTISQNTFCKDPYSTKVHPGGENLQDDIFLKHTLQD